MSNPNIIEDIAESIFHEIYKYQQEKIGITLQMVGGTNIYDKNREVRGNFHVLLVGDPGSAKSAMLKIAQRFAPKSQYVVGVGVSAAGLTAAVVKDDLLGGFTLEAGALPLNNNGLLCVSGGQFIMTSYGLKRMADITQGEVLTSFDDGLKNQTISKKIYNGKKKVSSLILDSGEKIVCTPDHKILTNKGWKRLDECKVGDFVVIPANCGKLNPPKSKKEKILFEKGIIHGFCLSDAILHKNKNEIRFTQALKNRSRRNAIEKLIRKIYRVKKISKSKVRPAYSTTIRGNRASFGPSEAVIFSCTTLHSELEALFKYNKLTSDSDHYYLGLLCGVLSTDACIPHKTSVKGVKHVIDISIGRSRCHSWTKDKNQLLCSLFSRFGIFSRIRHNKLLITSVRSYNRVVDLFAGKLLGTNRQKLYRITPHIKIASSDSLLNYDYVSWFKKIKFKTSKTVKLGLHSRIYSAKKNNRVTEELMDTLKQHWKDITDEKFRNPDKNYLLNKIISIEKHSGVVDVYDVVMDGKPNFSVCGGVVHNCIDELDKITDENKDALHEPLEQQTVSISKASIQATLLARTSVLAAANPKRGSYGKYETIYKQINMADTLIDRFDLVFPIRESKLNSQDHKQIGLIIFGRGEDHMEKKDVKYDAEFIKKYLIYAKRLKPRLPKDVMEYLADKYEKIKSARQDGGVLVTGRTANAIKRVTQAVAKIRLHNDITKEDADFAYDLVMYSMTQIGINPDSGENYIVDMTSGKKYKERDLLDRIIRLIREKSNSDKGKPVDLQYIIAVLESENYTDQLAIEKALEKLKTSGEIFEPQTGRYAIL